MQRGTEVARPPSPPIPLTARMLRAVICLMACGSAVEIAWFLCSGRSFGALLAILPLTLPSVFPAALAGWMLAPKLNSRHRYAWLALAGVAFALVTLALPMIQFVRSNHFRTEHEPQGDVNLLGLMLLPLAVNVFGLVAAVPVGILAFIAQWLSTFNGAIPRRDEQKLT